jgi:hypothetical protein
VLYHEDILGSEGITPPFLTSALDLGEWSDSHRERASHTHWTGDWVGPRTDLNDVEKRKFLILPGPELSPPSRPAVANRSTDCAISAPIFPNAPIKNRVCTEANIVFGKAL